MTFIPSVKAKLPLAMTKGYLDALDRSDGQCEFVSGNKDAHRCQRYINGGHRLYLTEAGRLYCDKHFDLHRRAGK